jgi:hypothetical protein
MHKITNAKVNPSSEIGGKYCEIDYAVEIK